MKTDSILKGLMALAFSAGIATAAAAGDTYVIDPAHSTVGFLVQHLTVSQVQGQFNDFQGTIDLDPADAAATKVDVTIQTKSIDTRNENRDKHLRSPDFFDADKNPLITFQSSAVTADGKAYSITGDLTIKGVTKKATVPLVISGPITNPMGGGQVIGLSGQTKINRQDFGVSWNKQMDKGGFVVGNDVQININLEAHAK